MNFYNALQLDPSILKKQLRASDSSSEQWFYRFAIVLRSLLIVLFAILFISFLSGIFGTKNTPMAVVLFCILLGIRFVNFNYCISDSLITLAASLLILLFVPSIATLCAPSLPFLTVFLHFIGFFAILFMTCQRPELGNGGLYSFAYVYLSGNPASGEILLNRFFLTLIGYLICASILLLKHHDQNLEIRFRHVAKNFSLSNLVYRWQFRMALGVSLILTLGAFLQTDYFMWMGFACASLLSSYPYSNDISLRFLHRILGAVAGSLLFYIIFSFTPVSLRPLLGPLGGFGLGFCTDYRFKTAFNCFGALMIGANLYGLGTIVFLRIWNTFLGAAFALFFVFLYHRLIETKFPTTGN